MVEAVPDLLISDEPGQPKRIESVRALVRTILLFMHVLMLLGIVVISLFRISE